MDRRDFLKAATFAAMGSMLGKGLAGGLSAFGQVDKANILVAYFSWSGNTRGIARQIQQQTGRDIFEIVPVKPYSTNYNTCLDEALRDQRGQARPPLKNLGENIGKYDVIFIGYPNWWASIPMPVAAFLESYDFSGKMLVPFCSHGGGRLGQSVAAIAKLCPNSTILEALSVHYSGGSSLPGDITAWLGRISLL
ncbi:MAG: NAD(P)H-dependent oxidoreductase [Planctomycetota bacterium]|nr:NAD(P)H-dependent oxidoreductase [Planctomycetota bacterium]